MTKIFVDEADLKKHDDKVKADVLDALVKRCELIDDCEFSMFSLCLIKELVEELKGGGNDN